MKKYVTLEITLEENFIETELSIKHLSKTDYFKWCDEYYLIINKIKCADETFEIEAIRIDKDETINSFNGETKAFAGIRREVEFK